VFIDCVKISNVRRAKGSIDADNAAMCHAEPAKRGPKRNESLRKFHKSSR